MTRSARDNGQAYALVAAVAFCAASVAVYLVNDVLDPGHQDRRFELSWLLLFGTGLLEFGQSSI